VLNWLVIGLYVDLLSEIHHPRLPTRYLHIVFAGDRLFLLEHDAATKPVRLHTYTDGPRSFLEQADFCLIDHVRRKVVTNEHASIIVSDDFRCETAKGATSDAIDVPLATEVIHCHEQAALMSLVMAHPDDESMFFLPTAVSLLDTGAEVWVPALTTGNYDGSGEIRMSRGRACQDVIGIKGYPVDEPAFPDPLLGRGRLIRNG
jgi:hypothetical protein